MMYRVLTAAIAVGFICGFGFVSIATDHGLNPSFARASAHSAE